MKIPIFEPLATVPKRTETIIIIVEAIIALLCWQFFVSGLIPGPITVGKTLLSVISEPDFIGNLVSSIMLTLKAMCFSMIIALVLTYLSVIPVIKPITNLIAQFRYLTLTGLIFLFTLLTQNGSQLKISLLIFGIVPFFVTSLTSLVANIDNQKYDLCRTLRFNNWETLYEVIILGQLDMALEVMGQNFAISWLMITMVEGLSMSEGGLGVMIIKANKYLNLPRVFALLVLIFLMGILFSIIIKWLRRCFFPYSTLHVK